MVKRYVITFPDINSDIYDIEMMELDGVPLFILVAFGLEETMDAPVAVLAKNDKTAYACEKYGFSVITKDQLANEDVLVSAYQPFKYYAHQYEITRAYKNLEVVDLKSYLFAKYILEQTSKYTESHYIKKNKAEQILNEQNNDASICFIGDSLIEYWDIDKITGNNIFKAGIGDLTSAECFDWLVSKIDITKFDTCFILVGTNDLKYKFPIDSVIANLQNIVAYIKENNTHARVILSLVPNVHRRWDRRNDAIQILNDRIRNTFSSSIELFDPSFLNNDYGELDSNNTTDGLHFSEIAYKQFYKQLEFKINSNDKI